MEKKSRTDDELRIRNVDPAVKKKLEKLARDKKMSLSGYCKSVLETHVDRIDVVDMDAKYRKLVEDVTGMYTSIVEKTGRTIEENTYALNRFAERGDE